MPTEIAARAGAAAPARRRRRSSSSRSACRRRSTSRSGWCSSATTRWRCSSRSAGPARCATSSARRCSRSSIVGQGAVEARTQPGAGRRGAADRRRRAPLRFAAGPRGADRGLVDDQRRRRARGLALRVADPRAGAGGRSPRSPPRIGARVGAARRRDRRRRSARGRAPATRPRCPALDERALSRAAGARPRALRAGRRCCSAPSSRPLTFMAMLSAVLFSSELLATPDSTTLPFERLDLDRVGVDRLVLDHAGLDRRRDRRVVDVGADRFLAAHDGAAGGASAAAATAAARRGEAWRREALMA